MSQSSAGIVRDFDESEDEKRSHRTEKSNISKNNSFDRYRTILVQKDDNKRDQAISPSNLAKFRTLKGLEDKKIDPKLIKKETK